MVTSGFIWRLGLLQSDISCRLLEQTPESAKHILMECKHLDIGRRTIFVGNQLEIDIRVSSEDKLKTFQTRVHKGPNLDLVSSIKLSRLTSWSL